MVDTAIPNGDPGVAAFQRESFGGIEVISGDTPISSTTESVGENTDLPIYSVVGRDAAGDIALATFGAAGVAATGALTLTAAGVADETITIGTTVYTLKAAAAAANEVTIGADEDGTADNLVAAINGDTGEGTTYGTGTTPHADVVASRGGTGVVELQAKVAGQAGEAIATTETSTVASFGAATLTGGVGDAIAPVGITTAKVTTGAGVSTTVDVYRSGMFNPDALNWDASFGTDAQKKQAFEGSISPNIFMQRNKHQAALP